MSKMSITAHKSRSRAGILFVVVFLLDRLTKWLILYYKPCNYSLITHFCSLHYTKNRGISWGLFHNADTISYWLLTILIALFLVLFIYYFFNIIKDSLVLKSAQALIVAGGMSNLIDRLVYHGVIDFIVIYRNEYVFPIFNIADCAVVLGVLIIMIYTIWYEK